MSVSASIKEKTLTIQISGTLNGQLQKKVREAYKNKNDINQYIIDLGQTTYADSAGLGLLLAMYGFVKGRNDKAQFKIINSKGGVREILLMSKFEKFFKVD